jgi:hypothetical protein
VGPEFTNVVATPWGYCLFQSGFTGAACDAVNDPTDEDMEQLTCGRCPWLAAGPGNIEICQTSYLLHEKIASHPLHTVRLKEASSKFMAVAARILRRHGFVLEGGA